LLTAVLKDSAHFLFRALLLATFAIGCTLPHLPGSTGSQRAAQLWASAADKGWGPPSQPTALQPQSLLSCTLIPKVIKVRL